MSTPQWFNKQISNCSLFTDPSELRNIGVHDSFEDGTRSSPKNRNPPPRPARQCPTTLLTWPRSLSCDTIVALLLLRPRTPPTEGGGCKSPFSWSYPQLHGRGNRGKEDWYLVSKEEGQKVLPWTKYSISSKKKKKINCQKSFGPFRNH